MAVSLSQYAGAGAQFFDNDGNPLAGGLIYTYTAGTTTPAATYTTYTGGTANTNPIVLDSAGRTPAQIWLTAGSSYKFVLQTSLGVTIKTDDNIFASFELNKEVGVTVGRGPGNIASNIAVGDTALDGNTSGSNNVAIGYQALLANTTGFQNVGIGSQCLKSNTGGDYNVSIGYESLNFANSNYNTAMGHRSMAFATTGTQNVAIGAFAMLNKNCSNSVAVGYDSLRAIGSGGNNVAIGVSSLLVTGSGANNTAIGTQAGDSLTTGSNNTVIGYDADVSAAGVSNEVTIGNSSVTSLRVPGLTLTAGLKWINNGTQTVAALVAAGTAGAGARAVVTDANATTFHSVVAGGGANVVPVFSDGTDWRIG